MKPWKYLIVIAGTLSVIGVFVPLLTIQKSMFEQKLSARDLTVEGYRTNAMWHGKIPQLARDHLPAELRSVEQDVEDALLATRLMALAFAPGGLLLAIGLISAYRGQAGRLAGLLAVLFGVISIAATFALRWGMAEYSVDYLTIKLEPGAYMPMIIGTLGVIGGVGVLTARTQRSQ
jgi:hypothetical protein